MKNARKIAVSIMIAVTMSLMIANIALADGDDYDNNKGRAKASASGQYHGAFQYYGGNGGDLWVPDSAQQGGIGDTTGPANSAGSPWGAQNP